MTNVPEVIDIGNLSEEAPVITLNKTNPPNTPAGNIDDTGGSSSSNFGGGIELLMNEKRRPDGKSTPKSDIDLGDLNKLENELNNLSDDTVKKTSVREAQSDLFSNTVRVDDNPPMNVQFNEATESSAADKNEYKPAIGESTANTDEERKTWDGYGKFNNIPVDPDKHATVEPQLSKEELLREKFSYLRKLEGLEQKGVHLTKKYTMESPLAEMKGEYETHVSEKEKKNSMKFQGKMLMAAITGLEFLNNRFDPFDFKLDGWGEQVNENIDDYDDIFSELHEKYKSKASMAPELKLLFQLGGSALMIHMTNTMFKSSMPGMDDIMKQNPELMEQFTKAAASSMSDTTPGFGGFMSNLMEDQIPNQRPPPAPVATQGRTAAPPPRRQGQVPNRPDITMGRGPPEGVDMENQFINPNAPEKTVRHKRPDMQGPKDITGILSGLKTKKINIRNNEKDETSSKVSIAELKDMENEPLPHRLSLIHI